MQNNYENAKMKYILGFTYLHIFYKILEISFG